VVEATSDFTKTGTNLIDVPNPIVAGVLCRRQAVHPPGCSALQHLQSTKEGKKDPRMDEEARLQDGVFHRGEGGRARTRSEHGERWNCREEPDISHFDTEMGINIESAKTAYPFMIADARDLPFDEDYVDFALANAVIERVGGQADQERMICEMTRVARCWVITPPNLWFPMESHTFSRVLLLATFMASAAC
jgi:hypothetical protein